MITVLIVELTTQFAHNASKTIFLIPKVIVMPAISEIVSNALMILKVYVFNVSMDMGWMKVVVYLVMIFTA